MSLKPLNLNYLIMNKLILLLVLVLVALGVWWYMSPSPVAEAPVSVETIEEVDAALGSVDDLDLDKDLDALDAELNNL